MFFHLSAAMCGIKWERERDRELERATHVGRQRFYSQVWQQTVVGLCFVMVLIKFLTGARPKIAPHKTKYADREAKKQKEK